TSEANADEYGFRWQVTADHSRRVPGLAARGTDPQTATTTRLPAGRLLRQGAGLLAKGSARSLRDPPASQAQEPSAGEALDAHAPFSDRGNRLWLFPAGGSRRPALVRVEDHRPGA